MAARMTPQTYSPLCGSPAMHQAPRSDYSSWKEIKTELNCRAYPMDNYGQNTFQGSPQSLPSCMFSSHSVSPTILPPLPFSERPHHLLMPGSKENGTYFREVPQCRRRLDFNHNSFMDLSKPIPVAVAKRNERERNRVKLINMTFQTLRQHLPVQSRGSKGKTRKLSKVQTLRSAIDYIRKLENLINDKKQECHFQEKEDSKTKAKFLDDDDAEEGSDRLALNVTEMVESCAPYSVLYKPHNSSPGIHQRDIYSSEHSMSSPEKLGSTSYSAGIHEEPSPMSETSSYEVVAAEDDEFLDFDFWF